MITIFNIRPKGFNVGNDAINMGMQQYLYKAFGEVVNLITLPATARYESHASAGLTKRTIHDINQFGDGVIIGGGNLYENGEIDVDTDALKALGVPMMIFSVSRGRIYNRRRQLVDRTDVMPDRIIKALNERAQYSLARDQATYDHLQNLGISKCIVGGCPTVFLDRSANALPDLPGKENMGVLISVRNPTLMNVPLSKQATVQTDIRSIVSFLRSEGHSRIRLLCHDHRDIAFAASFGDLEYIYTGDVYSYLAMLKACSLNVSYRLHSALPCLAYGTPFIKISYDERASSLLQTLGYGEWNINMVEAHDTVELIKERYSRLEELPSLKQQNAALLQTLDSTMLTAFQGFAKDVMTLKIKDSER